MESCDETKGHRLYNPAIGNLHKSRDIVFFEYQKYENKRGEPGEQAVPLTETVCELVAIPVPIYHKEIPGARQHERI